jgi:hypothetical protein
MDAAPRRGAASSFAAITDRRQAFRWFGGVYVGMIHVGAPAADET